MFCGIHNPVYNRRIIGILRISLDTGSSVRISGKFDVIERLTLREHYRNSRKFAETVDSLKDEIHCDWRMLVPAGIPS